MRKIIYSLRVMTELAIRGFQPVVVMPNPKNAEFNCWVYDWTPELQAALDEVFGNGR